MRDLILSLLAAVVVVGCSKEPGATPPAPTPPGPTTSAAPTPPPPSTDAAPPHDPSMFTCTADADCMLVEMGCCDHWNGGWILSINRAHVDAATARYHEKGCTNRKCTERGGGTPVAFCKASTCARRLRNINPDGWIEVDNTLPQP